MLRPRHGLTVKAGPILLSSAVSTIKGRRRNRPAGPANGAPASLEQRPCAAAGSWRWGPRRVFGPSPLSLSVYPPLSRASFYLSLPPRGGARPPHRFPGLIAYGTVLLRPDAFARTANGVSGRDDLKSSSDPRRWKGCWCLRLGVI